MPPFQTPHYTVFGGSYVQEHHAGFNLQPSAERRSLAPWGLLLCALLVAATTLAVRTTTAAMAGLDLASLS
jgi:hypothetical protein